MCLERVEQVYKGTSRMVRIGVKMFMEVTTDEGDCYLYPYIMYRPEQPLRLDTWLDEVEYRCPGTRDRVSAIVRRTPYPVGWHVYMDDDFFVDSKYEEFLFPLVVDAFQDAGIAHVASMARRVARRVLCKGLLARGRDDQGRIVHIYRYIKIGSVQ